MVGHGRISLTGGKRPLNSGRCVGNGPSKLSNNPGHQQAMQCIYCLFVTALLFLPPAELLTGMEGISLYQMAILLGLTCSAASGVRQLSPAHLIRHPYTFCLLGFMGTVFISQLAQLNVAQAREWGMTALKAMALYVLLAANLASPTRLRLFLSGMAGLVLMVTVLALLQYYAVINISALIPYQQVEDDPITGGLQVIPRLNGPGIFNDPNDLCVILGIGILVCLYRLGDHTSGSSRFAWSVPLAIFCWAVVLTLSRGGLLALAAGLFVLLRARFGTRKAIAAIILLLALIAVPAGASRLIRVNMGDQENTAQSRIQLWSEALVLFRGSPLTGIGAGEFVEQGGHVVHNSFLHSFTEEGFFGGAFFLGAFVCALMAMSGSRNPDPGSGGVVGLGQETQRLQLHLLAILVALTVGMLSLSRSYSPLPYLILGLIAAYCQYLTRVAPGLVPRLTGRLSLRLAGIGIAFLLAMKLFVTVFARWDVPA
jgi:putative inorganic carbon (hco3(-)) transporter